MPHYKDGTEATIGDQVFGKLYNTPGLRAGTIVSITPGVDSCNCMVEFVMVSADIANDSNGVFAAPQMAIRAPSGGYVSHPQKTQQHGSEGADVGVFVCRDYCAINELTRVGP